MNDNLTKKLAHERRFNRKDIDGEEEYFVLGLADGTVKTGNPYEAWARDLSGHPVRVINQKCPNIAGTPIYAEFRDGRYWVTRVRQRYPVPMSEMPEHAQSHKRFGSDPDFVEGERFEPDLIIPIPGSPSVRYYGGIFDNGTTTAYVPAQDLNLSGHVPATPGYARYVRIEKTDTGILAVVNGTFILADILTYSDIPPATPGNQSIFAIKLRNGASEILQTRFVMDEVIDLRFSNVEGGGSGGGGGDMLKAVYDSLGDGIVNEARVAPWTGVSGKPATFTPAVHIHSAAEITTGTLDGDRLGAPSTTKKGGVPPVSATPSATKFLTETQSWAVPAGGGGGGGSSYPVWTPSAPPTSPTTQDDEFSDGSFDAKWTEFDPNNILTVDESSTYKALVLTQATRSGNNITGVYQTLPAGDFTAYIQISVAALFKPYTLVGFGFWEDPTDTSKRILLSGLGWDNNSISWEAVKWNNHNSYGSTPFARTVFMPAMFIRVRRNGSNYYHATSPDGLAWVEYEYPANPDFTPLAMGICLDNDNNTGADLRVIVPFFRYVASDQGVTGILHGQIVNLPIA